MIKLDASEIDSSIHIEDLEEAVRVFFKHGSTLEMKVSLNKRPFRGTAVTCTMKPKCYICAAREEKSRGDYILGTMRFVDFREAAPKKKQYLGPLLMGVWQRGRVSDAWMK